MNQPEKPKTAEERIARAIELADDDCWTPDEHSVVRALLPALANDAKQAREETAKWRDEAKGFVWFLLCHLTEAKDFQAFALKGIEETAQERDRAIERAEKAEQERDRLAAEREWRPIETAPKDGTPILCWCPNIVTPGARILAYSEHYECWMRAFNYISSSYEPTRWQPLPAAPKEPM